MTLCLLTIIIPSALEDVVIDWLLEEDDVNGFDSMSVLEHGSDEENMSLVEKVTGRTRKIMFQTQIEFIKAEGILSKLKKNFVGSEIQYRIFPILQAGHLDSYEQA